MCSRYSLTSPPEAVRAYFGHLPAEPFPPRYNIAPTQPVHIVRTSAAGTRELVLVRWGLVPGWVKDPREFSTLINARSETACQKPSFRTAMRHKRCLFPVTGFYEWVGPKGAKRPHLFQVRDGAGARDSNAEEAREQASKIAPEGAPKRDREQTARLFAFAGLYETWMGADGSELDSAAILTTRANATVRPIHERMPVILPPELFDTWLDCKTVDVREASEMLNPAPDDLLDVFEVSARLNNPTADGPDLQTPVRTTLF